MAKVTYKKGDLIAEMPAEKEENTFLVTLIGGDGYDIDSALDNSLSNGYISGYFIHKAE